MLKKPASSPDRDHVVVALSGSVAVYVATSLELVSKKCGLAGPDTTGPTLRSVPLTVTSVEGVPGPAAFRASTRTVYVLVAIRPVMVEDVDVTCVSETSDATLQSPDDNLHCTV